MLEFNFFDAYLIFFDASPFQATYHHDQIGESHVVPLTIIHRLSRHDVLSWAILGLSCR